MARRKRTRSNKGKYGVFMVDLGAGLHGVVQVVDFDDEDDGDAYCLLYKGVLPHMASRDAVTLVEGSVPVGAGGLIGISLTDPEFYFAGAVRPSLHYVPAAFRIGSHSVMDFRDEYRASEGDSPDPALDYSGASTPSVLIHALQYINGLPHRDLASGPDFLEKIVPLSSYFSESIVAARLAQVDREAGFDVQGLGGGR